MLRSSFILVLISISILFMGCDNKTQENLQSSKEVAKVVKVLPLSNIGEFKNSKEYPASIYSFQNTEMAFEVSGKIEKFYFNTGDKIKKGDILAQLDDTIYNANLNSVKSTYEKAQLDYVRFEKLYKTKSVSQAKMEEIRQHLEISKSNYEVAKKNFDNTKLKAEFDGIIAKKHVNDFARVNAKQVILTLQDNSKFKVKFFIPENDILQSDKTIADKKIASKDISKIADFYVYMPGDENLKYTASFFNISTKAEEVTRTYETTLLMDNPKNKNIFSGMTAKVLIVAKQQQSQTLFIPIQSVFTDSSKNSFVWIVKNNRVYKNQITTGKLQDDSIAVLEGLKAEDTIVISGVNILSENDLIQEYQKLGN